jgi:hypothetical protein
LVQELQKANLQEQELTNQRVKIEQKGDQQVLQDHLTILQQSMAAYKQWAQQVSSSMFSGVNSWMQHQKTFTQGMKQEWNSLAMDSIRAIEQIGEKWVMQHVLMRAASFLFHTTDLAQHTTVAAAKTGIDAAYHTAQITANGVEMSATAITNVLAASSYAAVAAAAALASTAAIPIVGPALAPAAAAAMYSTGMGFAGMATFDEGGVVPKTQVAMVHAGERVLTGRQTNVFEQMVNQQFSTNNSRSGGDTHQTYSPTIHALDGASVARVLKKNSGKVFKEMARAVRMGRLRGVK